VQEANHSQRTASLGSASQQLQRRPDQTAGAASADSFNTCFGKKI
jgi:hypothetical protein